MNNYEVLRKAQKKIKQELNELKIKIYYAKKIMDLESLFKLTEIYDLKKKQLVLIKLARQRPMEMKKNIRRFK